MSFETLPDLILTEILHGLEYRDILSLAATSKTMKDRVKRYLQFNRRGRRKEVSFWVGSKAERDENGLSLVLPWTRDLPFDKYKELITAVRDGMVSAAEVKSWGSESALSSPMPPWMDDLEGLVEKTICIGPYFFYGIEKSGDDKWFYAFCARKHTGKKEWAVKVTEQVQSGSRFFTKTSKGYFFVGYVNDEGEKEGLFPESHLVIVVIRNGVEICRNMELKMFQYSDIRFGIKKRQLEIMESDKHQAFISKISLENFNVVTVNRKIVLQKSIRPHRVIYFCREYLVAVEECFVFHPMRPRWRGKILLIDRATLDVRRVDEFDNKAWDYEGFTKDGLVVMSRRRTLPFPKELSVEIKLVAPFDATYVRAKIEGLKGQ